MAPYINGTFVSKDNGREAATRWLIVTFGLSRAEAGEALDAAGANAGRYQDQARSFEIEAVRPGTATATAIRSAFSTSPAR